ncbi:MAG: J domain-containing protein [Coriobacteriia bacterium]|nr:J domain-containing protein [Coriobacteriia bacterium]
MNHYRVLQVDPSAEPEVIERAYKALCLKYHPDVVAPGQRDAATRRMQRINHAYSVLRDKRSRRQYDSALVHPATSSAWDEFLNKGLLGMLLDKVASQQR